MKKLIRFSLSLKNATVRTNVAALLGLILNAFYIVFNFVSGIIYSDAWFVAVGAYYFLIFSLRFILIRDIDEQQFESAQTARVLMLVLGVPITGMIIYNVLTSGSKEYGKLNLPIFFLYTVYSVIRAVSGIKRSKKTRNLTHRALHTLRLSAALMSLFNFQTSLLSALRVAGELEMLLNFLTGTAVSLSVFAMVRKTAPTRQGREKL